jgi:carbon starvation protein CstA
VAVSGVGFFGAAALALLCSLTLPALGRSRMRQPVVTVIAAALLVLTVSLIVYTFASESYKNDGRSVWEAFDWRHRLLLTVAIVFAASTAGLSVATRRHRSLSTWLPMATFLVVFLDYIAVGTTLE